MSVGEIPQHTHGYITGANTNFNGAGGNVGAINQTAANTDGGTGGGGAHSHTLGAGSVNLAVSYLNTILCVKN